MTLTVDPLGSGDNNSDWIYYEMDREGALLEAFYI